MIHAYLYESNLASECLCRYTLPSFVEELIEEWHREKILPNLIRIFSIHRKTKRKLLFRLLYHKWLQTTITPMWPTIETNLFMNNNTIMCRVFPTTLKGTTFHWYTRLTRNSIDSFVTLIMRFGAPYMTNIPHHLTVVALANIR